MGKYQSYSVLMSVYYKEKPEYLSQAIKSMQMQTFPTNDFVLVCDGPLNDALDEVIAAKQREMGKVLDVVRLAKNSGLGNALNVGITYCIHTYVTAPHISEPHINIISPSIHNDANGAYPRICER